MALSMTKEEMTRLAKIAVSKNWDFEQLKYSDYLYGKESLADEIFDLVEECRSIGTVAFDKKYPASF